ncbi:hypothetical protein R6Q59_028949 [Mikania micrantha]
MDKQYCSQPTDKPSKWILSKWRTLKSTDATTSEKPLDNRGKNILEKESVPTEHIRKCKWAILDDESDNWSKDVVEFFHAGDLAFCYSAHIEGWVGRLMKWRNREVQSNPSSKLRWTILPPSFVYLLLDSCNKNSVKFANGKFTPFPSFFDIDFV